MFKNYQYPLYRVIQGDSWTAISIQFCSVTDRNFYVPFFSETLFNLYILSWLNPPVSEAARPLRLFFYRSLGPFIGSRSFTRILILSLPPSPNPLPPTPPPPHPFPLRSAVGKHLREKCVKLGCGAKVAKIKKLSVVTAWETVLFCRTYDDDCSVKVTLEVSLYWCCLPTAGAVICDGTTMLC